MTDAFALEQLEALGDRVVMTAVMSDVTAWQSRPLEPVYPVVYFDALRVKIREDAVVRYKVI